MRYLGKRLLDRDAGTDVSAELVAWACRYERRVGAPNWCSEFAAALPSPRPSPGRAIDKRAPPHQRILAATAHVLWRRGYRSATVSEIASVAKVSRRSFYGRFDSKLAAAIACYEEAFDHVAAACAPAFLRGSTWSDRVWDAGLAFSAWFAREPCLAHVCFVEYCAAGPTMMAFAHERQLAFTSFLEEGNRLRPGQMARSRTDSELTAMLVMELSYLAVRRGVVGLFPSLLPLATYLVLTPFMGAEVAGPLIAHKVKLRRSLPGRTRKHAS